MAVIPQQNGGIELQEEGISEMGFTGKPGSYAELSTDGVCTTLQIDPV